MQVRPLLAAAVVTLLGAAPSSAQVLSLEFSGGRVRLIAENVPVSQILAEWARLGGTKIVNGERIPGPPVTLQLTDVSERQALDVILRGAAGYMVAARETPGPGASAFDRILVLPTTSRAPSAAPLPPPPPPPLPRLPNEDAVEEPEFEDPVDDPSPDGIRRDRFPPDGPFRLQLPEDDAEAEVEPVETEPGNPFGVLPGSSRPGVIATPPRRNDDDVDD